MRLLLSRHLKHLAASAVLLGAVGALISTTGVLGATGVLGTSTACACGPIEWTLEAGEEAKLVVTPPSKTCDNPIQVENISAAAEIEILKETGIECEITVKGCEGKTLKSTEKCESKLAGPGTKPEYELEVKWNGKTFTKKFPL